MSDTFDCKVTWTNGPKRRTDTYLVTALSQAEARRRARQLFYLDQGEIEGAEFVAVPSKSHEPR